MDRIADLIAQAAAAGLVLTVEGGELRVHGSPEAAGRLIPLLRPHKAAVIEAVERRAGTWPGLLTLPLVNYAALSWDELVRRLAEETAALPPEPEEPAPDHECAPRPWPPATVELRVVPNGRLGSGPLRGPDGAEIVPDGRRRQP